MRRARLFDAIAEAKERTIRPTGSGIARLGGDSSLSSLFARISTGAAIIVCTGFLGHNMPAVAKDSKAQVIERDLSAILRFREPSRCDYAEPLTSIFNALGQAWPAAKTGKPRAIPVPGFKGGITPTLRETTDPRYTVEIERSLAIRGTWHGLHVTRLVVTAPDASDFISEQIRFKEHPDYVRGILNRHGFKLPPPGIWRDITRDISTAIESADGETVLICADSPSGP